MTEPFVAEIRILACDFAPTGWAFCDGQILPISQNTALFSLLGVMYGGNGRSNFALPDLQGRAPVGQGQGPGLSDYVVGESGGAASITLLESEMPSHVHAGGNTCFSGVAGSQSPARAVFAGENASMTATYVDDTNPAGVMAPDAGAPSGGGQPHNNMMPFLALNFCIALQGVYPQRG